MERRFVYTVAYKKYQSDKPRLVDIIETSKAQAWEEAVIRFNPYSA